MSSDKRWYASVIWKLRRASSTTRYTASMSAAVI
jgi:hypothetical protein